MNLNRSWSFGINNTTTGPTTSPLKHEIYSTKERKWSTVLIDDIWYDNRSNKCTGMGVK